MKTLSITARLILGLTAVTTLAWCAAAAYATYQASHELNYAFDQTLKEAASRLLPLAADELEGHDSENDDAVAMRSFTEGRKQYLSYQLSDKTGRILLRSEDAPSEPYAHTAAMGFSTVGNYRLYTTRDERKGMTITVAETTGGRWEAVRGGAVAMLLPLLALVPLSVFGVWFTVRRAMRPVLGLSQDIATRGGSNLAPLDVSDQPRELRPIADAVARLVDRLRHALDAERAFAANAAHELRTPVAGALAQTQRLIAELPNASARARARDLEQTLKRLAALAEKLMQISRLDAGVSRADQPQDLLPVLDLVVRDAGNRLDEPERLVVTKAAALAAPMDLDAFAMALRNLIDNAIVHGAAGGRVEVIVEPGNIVRVLNDCPVVPAAVLHGLKRRFVRGATRAAGSGLGLSIVDQVMAQSGGRFDLHSPPQGRAAGFEARLTLPA